MKAADRKAGLLPGGPDVVDLDVERARRRKKKDVKEESTFSKAMKTVFKKRKEERKAEKAQDAGARLRRKKAREEYADKVSGSTENVPDDIRDSYEVVVERLGGKGTSRKAGAAKIHPTSGDWPDSDRGSGNKAATRAGNPPEKKSPTYAAWVKNKRKG